jgi:hypothetical protein
MENAVDLLISFVSVIEDLRGMTVLNLFVRFLVVKMNIVT